MAMGYHTSFHSAAATLVVAAMDVSQQKTKIAELEG